MVTFLHYRNSKLCRGHTFSNDSENHGIYIRCMELYTYKAMQTQQVVYIYSELQACLKAGNIKLNKNYIWDTLEIDWKEVTVTFNENKINLSRVVTIELQDKFKVRNLMNRQ